MKNDTLDSAQGKHPDFDSTYSPAVLAGLFEMSPSNIYQLQQRGIIPAVCTYRRAIQSYFTYWKTKADVKTGSINEIAAIHKSELDRVRTIKAWYEVSTERGELINKDDFVKLAQPIFTGLRAELIALERTYPDMREAIDKILNGIASTGLDILTDANKKQKEYVEREIDEMRLLKEEAAENTPDHPNTGDKAEYEQGVLDGL